jgi:hypothetical protein
VHPQDQMTFARTEDNQQYELIDGAGDDAYLYSDL